MDAGRFGAAQQRAEVLGILERVEGQDERRLGALDRAGEDRRRGSRSGAALDDQRDTLVAVEAGQRGQRPALDLDDRDPQGGRVEDELLECLAALRDDQQAAGRAAGRERLLDRPAAGDELLVRPRAARPPRRDRAPARRAAAVERTLAQEPAPTSEPTLTPDGRSARRRTTTPRGRDGGRGRPDRSGGPPCGRGTGR